MNPRHLLMTLPFLLAYGSCEPTPSTPAGDPAELASENSTGATGAPSCFPTRAVACGERWASDNGSWNDGATDVLDFHEASVGNYSGPEIAYWFDAAVTEEVTWSLIDPSPTTLNHDLFVMESADGCTAEASFAVGFNSLSFEAVAGRRYYLVVDGWNGENGPFEVELECAGEAAPTWDPSSPPDPFAPQPDTAEGLVNVSASLDELLERGALDGACEAWAAAPQDRRLELLCGKYRFFYEPMGTDGMPAPLLDWVGRNFPDFAGAGFSRFGLVPDPKGDGSRALGFGTSGSFGSAEALGMTCASCHFGRLPDGRYAVGYPNQQYDYGTHMLSIMLGPQAGMPGFDPADHHPDAIAAIQPMLDRFAADPALALGMAWNLLPLVTGLGDIPEIPYDVEGQYASWAKGTMDFLIAPLSADDGVHTVSRILPLWGIPDADDVAAYGSGDAQLGWTGGTRSLLDFARAFVHVGGGELGDWPDHQLQPLASYILSLRAPRNPAPPPAQAVDLGRGVFERACQSCHGGPRGGGQRIHDWEEIGTDDNLRQWGAPEDGELCCGLSDYDHSYDTGGVKAPRLVGLWSFDSFLHNGSVDSLAQLLCLQDRPVTGPSPFLPTGHTFGCDTLSDADKRDLIAFLETR
jgi:hypothetical protein